MTDSIMPGKCGKYIDMLSCYADGELTGQAKVDLESHLDQCASCRALLSVYQTIGAAAEEAAAEPPEALKDSVMNQIKSLSDDGGRQTGKMKKTAIRRVVVSFVAAAACLGLAFLAVPRLFGFGHGTGSTMSAAENKYTVAASTPAGSEETSSKYKAAGDGAKSSEASSGMTEQKPDGFAAATASAPSTSAGAPALAKIQTPQSSAAPVSGTPEGPAAETTAAAADGSTDDTVPRTLQAARTTYSQELKTYYAVITMSGPLPDILNSFTQTKAEDGTVRIEIPVETAKTLIGDGYTTQVGNENAAKALVIQTGD